MVKYLYASEGEDDVVEIHDQSAKHRV